MQKRLPALLIILSSLVVLFAGQPTIAFTPSVNIAPKPTWISACKSYTVKPNLRTVENGYYYALLEEQINVEKQATYSHVVKEIVSGTGVQNASDISVSFNPAYQKLEFHDITLWRNGKPENRLKASAFKMLADEDEFSRFIYNGTYAAKYILEDIRKGDRIEYSYTITGSNPIFYGKFCRTIFLTNYIATEHRYTTVLYSASRKLNMKNFNKVPAPVISNVPGGLKRYEWEDYKVKAVATHRHQPSWYEEFARVQFTEYDNWAEVADWGLKLNPVAADIKGPLREQIEKFKADAAGNKETYFRSATRFVQNEIRYMGIETGEYSHRANRPEKVFAQRYGDCKDKALLLASMLEADGIEAQMAVVATDLAENIDNYLPSNTLSDHAIVVATINGKQVWIDATISDQGGTGTNIYIPPYYRALILKQGNSKLSIIPQVDPGKIHIEETYIVSNEKDPVKFNIKSIYTLNEADDIRSKLASSSTAETEKNYLDYYLKTYPKIEAIDSVTIIDDEKTNQLTTIEHYKIKNFFKRDSTTGKYNASFYANFIDEQLITVDENIKSPVALNYPYHIEYSIAVTLPEGWKVDEQQFSLSKPAYEFNKTVSVDTAKTLTHLYELKYLKSYIPADSLEGFKKDMKEITDHQLAFNFNYLPGISQTADIKLNPWTILTSLLITGLSIFFSIRFYRNKTESVRLAGYQYGHRIGGWLVLVMIGLAATVLYNLITLLSGDYFNAAIWNYYAGSTAFWYRGLLLFETAGNTLITCLAGFCFFIMANKRDITPNAMVTFYFVLVGFFVIDDSWAYCFKGSVSQNGIENLVRAVIVATIWISYFKLSVRVKETFIVPYPPHNLTYEHDSSNYELE